MSPSPVRIIPAHEADAQELESFPYFAATYASPPPDESEDDRPVLSELTTPEEEAVRLASVDQQIYEKLQKAERDAHDIAHRAYEEGFAAGESEGRAFGESQYTAFMQRLEGHIQELSQACNLLSHASEEEVLALAFAMGEYLAGQQLQTQPGAVKALLQTVLENLPFTSGQVAGEGSLDRAAMVVYLNPRDREDLGDSLMDRSGILVREDPELTRGSLRLESPEGVLDASLERRHARLMETILRHREQEGA